MLEIEFNQYTVELRKVYNPVMTNHIVNKKEAFSMAVKKAKKVAKRREEREEDD